MSECEQEEELTNIVNSLFSGIRPELCERIIEEGKGMGILTVANLLTGNARDRLYDRQSISSYAETVTDSGSDFVIPTKIESVAINYHFPTEEYMVDDAPPTISLLVHPLD